MKQTLFSKILQKFKQTLFFYKIMQKCKTIKAFQVRTTAALATPTNQSELLLPSAAPPTAKERTLIRILHNCNSIRQLNQIHLQVLVHGLKDSDFILPKLINLASDLNSLDYAVQTFEKSHDPNVVAYSTMIKCFIGKSNDRALAVYRQMKSLRIEPNAFTFTLLLRCFEPSAAVREGMVVHGDILKMGFGSSVFVQNTLLDFYSRSGGDLRRALQVFEEMPERDVVSWNSMIGVFLANDETESAMRLFDSMPDRNIISWNSVVSGLCKAGNMVLARSVFDRMAVRNEFSWNSMITGYVKLRDVNSARQIFYQMPEKTVTSWTALITGYTMIGDLESASSLFHQTLVKNVVTWNALISGFVHKNKFDQALNVFHQMLLDGKCRPNESTLISVLCACSRLGSLEHGKWVDSYIKKKSFELSNPLGNALIDMFAKCGDIENAKMVFIMMGSRSLITWTAMISGLALNGLCREAIDIFDKMCLEGTKPDDVTFVAVLSACSHGGLIEEGKRLFKLMVQEFGIEPRIEHYGCMVDLLGRAGKLGEANEFIKSMHLEPNAVIWATLLGACKIHGKGELLESVCQGILDQEPSNPSSQKLISNMTALIGQWEDCSSFWASMRRLGIEKVPGCSLIQIGTKVHEFLSDDTRHMQGEEIYSALYCLNGHLREPCDNATFIRKLCGTRWLESGRQRGNL